MKKEQETSNIGALFDRIAHRYDFLNHLLSMNIDRSWRRKAVSMLDVPVGSVHVLDVAVGTGDLALEILRQHKASAVTGLDVSVEMMRLGQEKVAKAGLSERVVFCEGSAMAMPMEDACFEAVTCAYGVRNFADLDAGLREMYRVLKPGGQLMILEFSHPTNRFFAWVYDLYFSHLLPFVGRLISGDKTAYRYLNRSVKAFVDGEQMCERLSQAGFSSIHYTPLTYGITTVYTARKLV